MVNYYRAGLLLWVTLMLGACNKSYQQAFGRTEEMKKYGLVFRLQDYRQRIDYFERQGLADRAKMEKSEIEQDNRDLVVRFQKEFDFCPLYFYYSSQHDELLAGKPVLLNSQLALDTSIPLPEKIIVATFAPGKIIDNSFEWVEFRIVGTTLYIRPTYKTWWGNKPIQPRDVRRVNRILYKMNESEQGVRDRDIK